MIRTNRIIQLKPCLKCIHFIGHKTKDYGKCKMFFDKDNVTGKVIYHYASSFRLDMQGNCGSYGKYFIEKK